MRDCSNVEVRELLPEAAAGALQGEAGRRMADHLAQCGDCVDELRVLRSARAVLLRAPAVDLSRIAVGVTSAARPRAEAARRASHRRVALRAAASLLLVAAGATSVALWKGGSDATTGAPASLVGGAAPVGGGLALTAGLPELSDSEIEALLTDIDGLDAAYTLEPDATLPSLAIGELGGA